MKERIRTMLLREDGQGMTEYGLVLSFIAFIAVVSIIALSDETKDMYQRALGVLTSR